MVLLYLLPLTFFAGRAISEITLSVLVLVFLMGLGFKLFKLKELPKWFICALVFTLAIAFSSFLNQTETEYFLDAIVWIRFPLFLLFVTFLVDHFPEKFKYYYHINLIVLIMYLIFNFYEVYYGCKARFEIPFGNPISGVYFARVSMPLVLLAFVFLCRNKKSFISRSSLLLLALSISFVFAMFATGHRNGFIALILGVILVFLFTRPNLRSLFLISISIIVGTLLGFAAKATHTPHYTQHISVQSSSYLKIYERGFKHFLGNPIVGYGPKMVEEGVLYLESNKMASHPHNHYVQAFAEVGILGGFSYLAMCFFLLIKFYLMKVKATHSQMAAFISLVVFFSPFFQSHDLWSSQFNGFTWFAIGFCYFMCCKNFDF